ncbi:MAG: hypothetical protein QGI60_01800 [archaeon]|jgi:hypothetical protein|nr:hypothetical protein [archaeon]
METGPSQEKTTKFNKVKNTIITGEITLTPTPNAAKIFAHVRNINVIGPDKKRHLVRIRMFQKESRAQQRQIRLIQRAGLLPWLGAASTLVERYAAGAVSKE